MQPRNPASTPDEPPRVGDTLADLRQAASLSLEALSRKAGVSKSMLSQIERGQANPTVAVVWRLANALGVSMGELLGHPPPASAASIELLGAHAAPAIRSPDGLCVLRILGPINLAGQFEWYELTVQAGGVLESRAHEAGTREHLSVMSGTLEVRSDVLMQQVRAGETARYAADRAHHIRNNGEGPANAWLVVVHPG